MTEADMRSFIHRRLLSLLSGEGARRTEALRDVLGLGMPDADKAALERLAVQVPELPQALYEKWIGMFADRLLETVPREQIADMCADTPESNATLQLVYSMFMESERMEAVRADDLKQLAAAADARQTTH